MCCLWASITVLDLTTLAWLNLHPRPLMGWQGIETHRQSQIRLLEEGLLGRETPSKGALAYEPQ